MSARTRRQRDWKEQQVAEDALITALQTRAEELAAERHHATISWQQAKKKWGRGARISWCARCTADVLILPYGQGKGWDKLERTSPAILGEAVLEECEAAR